MSQMQQIHDQLREMILSLDLGPGERVSERWLETKFAGSRTPVRAALMRLEGEGLVRREGRGWMVAPIELAEITQLAAFREAVETKSIRLVCERRSREDVEAIGAMLDSCGPRSRREEWHRVGTDFHVELAGLSGNAFIARAIEDIMTRLSRARWLEVWTEDARERSWREHRRILQCVRAGDAAAAAREVATHIRGGRDRLLKSLRDDQRGLRARGFAVIAGGNGT